MTASSKGLIFAIKRFAIHDGKGIRTTIFFKGCHMRCVWCHNPEGLKLKREIVVSTSKCIYCQRCNTIDTNKVMIDTGKTMRITNRKGVDYQKYITICPTKAIQYDATYYTIDSLIDEILKDQVFFNHGGGITLSGGEPLLQAEFVLSFLKRCKDVNIHTAVETALNVSLVTLKKILPYIDTLYCDIKQMNNEKHLLYTKVSNRSILEAIDFLLTSKYRSKVIVRTPLIPNLTDTKENLKAIATYIVALYADVTYELLNYNPLASSKYELLPQTYGLDASIGRYSSEQMSQFRQIIKKYGIKNAI